MGKYKRKYDDYSATLEAVWMQHYEVAQHYYYVYGCLPKNSKCVYEGFKLGSWLHNQKHYYRQGKISQKRIAFLEKLEIEWVKGYPTWDEHYEMAKKYYKEFGNLLVEQDAVYQGDRLGKWVHHQRSYYHSQKLSEDRIKKLDSIGMVWRARKKKD